VKGTLASAKETLVPEIALAVQAAVAAAKAVDAAAHTPEAG
jgi:hypothetical protein